LSHSFVTFEILCANVGRPESEEYASCGMSPATSAHGAKEVAVPQVPMTSCEACPFAGATVSTPEVVTGEFVTASHEGIERPTLITVPPNGRQLPPVLVKHPRSPVEVLANSLRLPLLGFDGAEISPTS